MKLNRWVEFVGDFLQFYVFAVMAGLVFGVIFGWIVGLGVAAGVGGLFHAVDRAARALVRKSFETKVPQRRSPRKPA